MRSIWICLWRRRRGTTIWCWGYGCPPTYGCTYPTSWRRGCATTSRVSSSTSPPGASGACTFTSGKRSPSFPQVGWLVGCLILFSFIIFFVNVAFQILSLICRSTVAWMDRATDRPSLFSPSISDPLGLTSHAQRERERDVVGFMLEVL